jgi:phosphohistidine phosphatase
MKQLILLRHAEAQAQRPGLADFDRSLTDHGRTEALDAADCLRRATVRIDALLASPALRAKETALIVAARLDYNHALLYEPVLYQGEATALLDPLQQCGSIVQTVLMVGHNPTLSALARHMAGDLEVAAVAAIDGRAANEARLELGTAGACEFELETDSWGDLQPQHVRTVTLLR